MIKSARSRLVQLIVGTALVAALPVAVALGGSASVAEARTRSTGSPTTTAPTTTAPTATSTTQGIMALPGKLT